MFGRLGPSLSIVAVCLVVFLTKACFELERPTGLVNLRGTGGLDSVGDAETEGAVAVGLRGLLSETSSLKPSLGEGGRYVGRRWS